MMRGKSLQLGYRKKAIFKQKCAVTNTKNTVFEDNHLKELCVEISSLQLQNCTEATQKMHKKKLERKITQLFEKKRIEKLHKLHTATENLNPKLQICTYNDLAIIPNLQKKKVIKRPKITQKGQ